MFNIITNSIGTYPMLFFRTTALVTIIEKRLPYYLVLVIYLHAVPLEHAFGHKIKELLHETAA